MKKSNRTFRLIRAAALCLTVAALSACEADDFTRNSGEIPGPDELTQVGGVLRREKTPEQISLIKIDEGTPAVDALFYQLNQPAPADVTVTVEMDESLLEAYNKDKEDAAKLTLFPADKVSFDAGKTLTVRKGEKRSATLAFTLSREGVEKGMYLLPLRAVPAGGEASEPEKGQILYYRVVVAESVPESELDAWKFKVVGYVNTEEMNPLMCNEMYIWVYDLLNDVEATKTWIDYTALRKAWLKYDANTGRAMLDLGPDLQYVLSNRDKYIVPLQRKSRKVLLCVTGGNTGLGFCNLTDAQIEDFLFQLKDVVDTYRLDGVNFFDIETNYGKDGMPTIDLASYPRLLKAAKEALGDKLVTVVCDEESSESLSEARDGIEAGKYIDYAWSGIFDEVIDAYAEGADLKPIAGLDRSKYGAVMMQTHETGWMNTNADAMGAALKSFYFPASESANVFAFWDMPASRAGIERGVGNAIQILCAAITDDNLEYDGMIYDYQPTPELSGYGKFAKDW